MFALRKSLPAFAVVCFCLTTALPTVDLAAGELRIETDVYSGDDSDSLSHTVTLFDAGTVYDFADKQQQVAVFRLPTASREGQFILLDLAAKRRTEVSTEKIETLMSKLSKWAMEQEDEMLKFSAKPDFDETYESESGQLLLDSEQWTYTVATVPAEDDGTLKDYRKFVDWYTRLNVMMHGAPPPGPRLALNAALEKHGVVPVEIRRKIEAEDTSLRATHLFSWRLSREDRAQVEQVREQLASFEKVDNKNFLASRGNKDVVRGQSR
ncbi:MAG: hypothetical protein AAGD11_12145 [Planctomycetota bacterium]